MSRIGKKPIEIPAGVSVSLDPGRVIVNGPLGELNQQVPRRMKLEQADGEIVVSRPTERGDDRALHGLTRSLIANMVEGVTKGFQKRLEIQGVGYRAALRGESLELSVGFSHTVVIDPPAGITFEVATPTEILVKGIAAQLVDDSAGKTLAAASSLNVRDAKGTKSDQAAAVGKLLAQNAKKAGLKAAVFDRGGYLYHGRVKALADAAREGGLEF